MDSAVLVSGHGLSRAVLRDPCGALPLRPPRTGYYFETRGCVAVIFQLSTSGSYQELYQIKGCTPKTGCSMVIQASDGNLWIADPPQESVYSITTGGALLQTVSFYGVGHPQRLIQASSGILYGTTGEPNPAYGDAGTVFSLNAGLPPPQ